MRVKRIFDFEAAHVLPNHPGKCKDLHGHSYRLVVSVDGPLDPKTGMTIDFGDLKKIVIEHALVKLDHTYLNDFIEIPTAEAISVWVWDRLKPQLPGLAEVELWETRTCAAVYRGA